MSVSAYSENRWLLDRLLDAGSVKLPDAVVLVFELHLTRGPRLKKASNLAVCESLVLADQWGTSQCPAAGWVVAIQEQHRGPD